MQTSVILLDISRSDRGNFTKRKILKDEEEIIELDLRILMLEKDEQMYFKFKSRHPVYHYSLKLY